MSRFYIARFIFVLCLAGVLPGIVSAAGGTALPWDQPVKALGSNLSGPMAIGAAVIAIAAGGLLLLFRPELALLVAGVFAIIVIAAFMVFGSRFLQILGITGATVTGLS